MFIGEYGPFATTLAIAAALIAFFSVLLMKAVGKVSQWTFLADDSPPFMVTAGARALAVALIALTLVFIDKSNYVWFGGAAAVCGVLLIVLIGWFDRVRLTKDRMVRGKEVSDGRDRKREQHEGRGGGTLSAAQCGLSLQIPKRLWLE
jgi:hypothetical protein